MARVQVDSRLGAEALQTVAVPKQQAVQQSYDPNSSKAFQLATALGANQPLIDKMYQEKLEAAQADAAREAGAIGAEELGRMVKSGELPVFKSPVYVATLKHVHGENGVEALKNEVHEGIKNGTLNFNSNAELDEYINKKRGEFLAGADRFTTTGFDKNLNQYRQTLSAMNTQILSKRTADRAEAEVFDNLKNIYNSASTDPSVSADTRVATIVEKYKNFRSDNVAILATPEKQKEALVMVARVAAENKDRGFLDRFMKADLGDGVTVEKALGLKGVDALYKEVDQVETRQYYQRLRAKSDATDTMTDVVIAEVEAGRDPLKTILNDERFAALEKTERIRLITRTKNTLSGADGSDGGFGGSKMQFISSQFDGVDDPEEALQTKYQLLGRAKSKEERAYIKEVYSQGKFQSPYTDVGFRVGKGIVQLAHKSTDSFIGSDTYGPALRNFQKDWSETFYLSGDELSKRFPEVIPDESRGRNLARQPVRVKEAIAGAIASKYESKVTTGSPGLSQTTRPVNPNSDRTLGNNEIVKQGDITIKKVPDTK